MPTINICCREPGQQLHFVHSFYDGHFMCLFLNLAALRSTKARLNAIYNNFAIKAVRDITITLTISSLYWRRVLLWFDVTRRFDQHRIFFSRLACFCHFSVAKHIATIACLLLQFLLWNQMNLKWMRNNERDNCLNFHVDHLAKRSSCGTKTCKFTTIPQSSRLLCGKTMLHC